MTVRPLAITAALLLPFLAAACSPTALTCAEEHPDDRQAQSDCLDALSGSTVTWLDTDGKPILEQRMRPLDPDPITTRPSESAPPGQLPDDPESDPESDDAFGIAPPPRTPETPSDTETTTFSGPPDIVATCRARWGAESADRVRLCIADQIQKRRQALDG